MGELELLLKAIENATDAATLAAIKERLKPLFFSPDPKAQAVLKAFYEKQNKLDPTWSQGPTDFPGAMIPYGQGTEYLGTPTGATTTPPPATVTSQPTGMETQMFEGERSPQSIYRRWASSIPGVQSTSPFAQYLNSMGYMALGNYLMNALPQYAGGNTSQSFADFMQNKQGGAFSSPGGSNYSALGNLWNMPQPGVGASDADLQAYQRAKEVMDYMDTTSEGRAGSFMGVLANSPIYNQLPGFMKSYARNRLGDVYNQYEDIAPAGTGFFPWLRKIYGV